MGEQARAGSVEVVYAEPDRQTIVRLAYEVGMTAADAVRRSGLAERYPEIDARFLVLGVFGTRVAPSHMLSDGDRVEICRPLLRDPRDLRRERAGCAAPGPKLKTGQDRA
jgi:hypothetical protein